VGFCAVEARSERAEAKAAMEPLFLHTQQWIPAEIGRNTCRCARYATGKWRIGTKPAWVLLGAVLAVLLIACANVASLFSARGAGGAQRNWRCGRRWRSRGRLIRQTLTEAVMLAIAGAAAGCVLAEILLRVFIAIAPSGVPFLAAARLDLRIVLFRWSSPCCAPRFRDTAGAEKPGCGAGCATDEVRVAGAVEAHAGGDADLDSRGTALGRELAGQELLESGAADLGMQTRNVMTVMCR